MTNEAKVLAVIPARGGSEGVPGKNKRPLGGAPLIVHTIDAAKRAQSLSCIAVSTDDDEIKKIARSLDVDVIDRPPELAGPEAATESALLHALEVQKRNGETFDYVATLEPTSPFREAATIDAGVGRVLDEQANGLVCVTPDSAYFWKNHGGGFAPLDPSAPRRRQSRAPLYREAGTLYVTAADALRRMNTVLAEPLIVLPVDAKQAFDINSMMDFATAEAILRLEEPK